MQRNNRVYWSPKLRMILYVELLAWQMCMFSILSIVLGHYLRITRISFLHWPYNPSYNSALQFHLHGLGRQW